jgi:hypothetical protein
MVGLAAVVAAVPAQTPTEPITLSVVSFTASPAAPRVGRTITARLAIKRSDTGGRLVEGRPSCRADIDGRAIPTRARGVRERAYFCTWLVPRRTKGKVLAVEVRVDFADARVARTFRKRIR